MPEGPDVALVRWGVDDIRAVVDPEAQSARPDLQQPMCECDQPSRAPAVDFQGGRLGAFVFPAISARIWQTDLIENPPDDSIDDVVHTLRPAVVGGDRRSTTAPASSRRRRCAHGSGSKASRAGRRSTCGAPSEKHRPRGAMHYRSRRRRSGLTLPWNRGR